MRHLDIPSLPPVDHGQVALIFGIFAVAGLVGFGFTLVRVGRQSPRPLLGSVCASIALLAWAGMGLYLSNWAAAWHREQQVDAATGSLRQQLLTWDRDDQVASRYGVAGLSEREVSALIRSIDFSRTPSDENSLVGEVERTVGREGRYRIELRWVSAGKYDYDLDVRNAPALQAARDRD